MCGKINMTDMLLDDVNSLLNGDFGDDRILKQIARACKNNEVISNYERNYVQKLAEQHLGKKPIISTKISEVQIPKVPDVVIPPIESITQTQIIESSIPKKSNLKNSKTLLAIGGIALVILISAFVLSSSNIDSSTSNKIDNLKLNLTIQTDVSSYAEKDIISINGISKNYELVNLSIKNKKNELVWAEQISVKNDGRYSTLAIAGGPGWEISGTYTLEVDNGFEKKSTTFSFIS